VRSAAGEGKEEAFSTPPKEAEEGMGTGVLVTHKGKLL
jgi:hypothetical protein